MNKKRIVCFGDSNTWGYDATTKGRYEDDVRWTQRLGVLLGNEYMVMEEGLPGRTSVFEDPLNEGLCGLTALTPTLQTHSPLDLLVVMLGTNDCKERFSANAQNIADGVQRSIFKAKRLDVWRQEPRILLVAPIIMDPRVYSIERICNEMGAGSVEKSRALPVLLEKAAQNTQSEFMDCNPYVTPGSGDYMHFSAESNEPFAAALAQRIRSLV